MENVYLVYPDPISNKAEAEVLSNTTQSMWVTFSIIVI